MKLPGDKSKQFSDFVRPKVVDLLLKLARKVEEKGKETTVELEEELESRIK